MIPVFSPPWYWAPYVVALGSLDWWQEQLAVSPAQAARAARQTVQSSYHLWLQRLAILVLFFCLMVYFVREVVGPWLAGGGLRPSAQQLLWVSALLSWGSMLLITALLLRFSYRALFGLYQRGLRVLRCRAAEMQ